MEWYWALAVLIGTVIFLMAMGVPVAMTFITTNIIGVLIFMGSVAGLTQIVDNATSLITTFTLGPVPMFIMMGALFFHTGLARRVFDGLDVIFGRIPGRLCYLTIAGGALYSTLTGSSMANTAMLGSLMLPEMRDRGYSRQMSMGPILGTGGLAMIIPPSSLGVLLASVANIDVGRLLISGFIPGFTLAAMFAALIYIQIKLDPSSAPSYDVPKTTLMRKIRVVSTNILPMGIVVFMVVGFILFGIATPTESAAFGVAGVFMLAIAFRCLTWSAIQFAMRETVKVGGMVFFILISSTVFSQLLAYSGASAGMLHWATSFHVSRLVILLIMFIILTMLGMFMDSVSMMLITVPIFFPLAHHLGFDLTWFGLFVLMTFEMAGTTPPFGLLLYVMLGVAPRGTTLFQVAKAAFPFLIVDCMLMLLLTAFPQLALWLPNQMGG